MRFQWITEPFAASFVAIAMMSCSPDHNPIIDPNRLEDTAHLTFAEEFDTLDLWNGTTGRWDTGYWWADENGSTNAGNQEQQWYVKAGFEPTASVRPWTVSEGVLTITADRASPVIMPLIDSYQYTSGILTTYRSFHQTYGYFEIRAKLPAGQGLWPAFWLMPITGKWPPELDVFEMLGHDPTWIYNNIHSQESGQPVQSLEGTRVPDTSKEFHTFGVNWEPELTTFYFDRKPIFTTRTPEDLHQPFYMIVNLAVGGYWPGNPNRTTVFPAHLEVDYIRAYEPFKGYRTTDAKSIKASPAY